MYIGLSVHEVAGKVDVSPYAGIVEYRISTPLAGSGD
jgi:hypothetical protein